MKKTQLHYFVYLAKSGGLLIVASLFRMYGYLIKDYIPNTFISNYFQTLASTLIYLVGLYLWGRKTYIRVVSRRMQLYFASCTGLMMLWFVFRTIKYITDDVTLEYYMWYSFYLPMIYLPLLSLHIALLLRNFGSKKESKKYHVLDIAALALYTMVMTNRLHNFVFIHDGRADGIDYYSHNWGYYLIAAWIVCIEILVIVTVIKESRIALQGFYFMYPIAFVLAGIVYNIVYNVLQMYHIKPFIDMTPFFCWIFCAMWEFIITAGLIPTNRYYVEFFNVSSISAYIADEEGNALYESHNAIPLTREDFKYLTEAGKITNVEGHEAYIYSLDKAYIVYENDTSEIVDMIEELEDARENLMGEKFIRQKANEAEAARIRIEEKEYLFEKLTGATISQLKHIRENMTLIDNVDEAEEKKLWEEIVILGTFVKRYSNLLLIKEGDPQISAVELQLSLQQSMENLKLMGVNTGMMIKNEGTLDIENILQCYELFENIVEWDLFGLKGIHVIFAMKDTQCTFLVEAECERGFEEFEFYEYDGKLDIEAEDNTISATLIWENRVRG